MPPPPQNPPDNFVDVRASANLGLQAVNIGAAGDRLLFTNPFTIGCWSVGWEAVANTLVIYPIMIQANPPTNEVGARIAVLLWPTLFLLMIAHGLISKRPGNQAHPDEIGKPWGGEGGNILLAPLAALLAMPFCMGITYYIAFGFAASWIQRFLILARFARMARIADAQRKEAAMLQAYLRKEAGK